MEERRRPGQEEGNEAGRGRATTKLTYQAFHLWKQCQTLFFWAPKSLQMVTAAVKLKDDYSLEGKL